MTFSVICALVAAVVFLWLAASNRFGFETSPWEYAALALAIVASVAELLDRWWLNHSGRNVSAAVWISIVCAIACAGCILGAIFIPVNKILA
jgi:uncharacterized membrane protein